MSHPKLLAAGLLALAGAAAHADVVFNFGSDAEGAGGTADYARGDAVVNGSLLSTGGPVTATAAGVQATVQASADAATGMFKAYTQIDMSGSDPHKIGQSYARLDVTDTLRFTGPGSSVFATFSLNYDTIFSGLGFAAFEREPGDGGYHFQQAASSRSIVLDYQVANPNHDPSLVCSFEGEVVFCPPEAQPYLSFSKSAGSELDSYTALDDRAFNNTTYEIGNVGNGRYTGVVTLSAVLPTNVDVQLTYFAINSARCFGLPTCSLVIDASHSDYLGLTVDGGSYVSASGYQYAGIPSAVPEPQTTALLLAGLAVVGGVARRRRG